VWGHARTPRACAGGGARGGRGRRSRPAAGDGLSFTPPQLLPHGDREQRPFLQGPEPSIAFDPTGDGRAYVVAPQGIPTAVGNVLGSGDSFTGVA
jgi:hypothetical protein